MITTLAKFIFIAAWISVLKADPTEPPPCDRIKPNSVMCSFERFQRQCDKECGNYYGGSGQNGNSEPQEAAAGAGTGSSGTQHETATRKETDEEKSIRGNRDSRSGKKRLFKSAEATDSPTGDMDSTSRRTRHRLFTHTSTDSPVSASGAGARSSVAVTGPSAGTHGYTREYTRGYTHGSGSYSHHSETRHYTQFSTRAVSGSTISPIKEHDDRHKNHETHNHGSSQPSVSTHRPSAKVFKNCNKVDPCVDLATANSGFRQRCQQAGIKETCWEYCHYEVKFDQLKKAMLSKQCPIDSMRTYIQCGAKNQDNRSCCEKTGVLEGKRAFCHPFCNPNGDEWPGSNQALHYMPCASQLNAIMRCHWAGLTE